MTAPERRMERSLSERTKLPIFIRNQQQRKLQVKLLPKGSGATKVHLQILAQDYERGSFSYFRYGSP